VALQTPTISEISANIIADIEAEYNQTIPLLQKAVFRIWAFISAGVFIILYKFGVDAFNNRFVQTANEEFLQLLGEQVGVVRTPAQFWIGTVDATVTQTGGVIQAGTQMVNNNTGVVYSVTTSEAIDTTPTETLNVESLTSGDAANLVVGDTLDFVRKQAGLNQTVTVASVAQEGADEEPTDQYRQRVLDRYQKQPQGGALADYELWAEETANVINAYPYASTVAGGVDVYIEVDNQTDGIPTQSQLDATLENINFDPETGRATRRPVTAEVETFAITRTTFTVEVTGLNPDTQDIRDQIDAAVSDLFLTKEPFIQGLSVERNDTITDAETTSVVQTIAASNGAVISDVATKEGGLAFDIRTMGKGEKAKVTTPLTYN
jgi:uncharacterized phage protein gp47/JayE